MPVIAGQLYKLLSVSVSFLLLSWLALRVLKVVVPVEQTPLEVDEDPESPGVYQGQK